MFSDRAYNSLIEYRESQMAERIMATMKLAKGRRDLDEEVCNLFLL